MNANRLERLVAAELRTDNTTGQETLRLSRTSVQMKNLAQEIAVLRVLVDHELLRRKSEVPGEDVS